MGRASRRKHGRLTPAERTALEKSIGRKLVGLLGKDAVLDMVWLNSRTTCIRVDGTVHLAFELDASELAPLVCGVPVCRFVAGQVPPEDIQGELADQPDIDCPRCLDRDQGHTAVVVWRKFVTHMAQR